MKISARSKSPLAREAAALAEHVRRQSAAFAAEDRDWLTEPLRHAADMAADHLAAGEVHYAESAVHEVQTWTLLALRHGHLSAPAANAIDRRCEAILDHLHTVPVRRAA